MSKVRFAKHFIKSMYLYGKYLIANGGDYDWDYGYLLSLMKWKMQKMATTIRDNDIIEANNRVAKQLEYAVYLIDQIQNKPYEDKMNAKHDKRWGEIVVEFVPSDREGYTEMRTSRPKAITEAQKLQERKEFKELINSIDAKERDLYNRLFKHMNTYIKRWWD